MRPVGYPDTAIICGSLSCLEPGVIWLEQDEAETCLCRRYLEGSWSVGCDGWRSIPCYALSLGCGEYGMGIVFTDLYLPLIAWASGCEIIANASCCQKRLDRLDNFVWKFFMHRELTFVQAYSLDAWNRGKSFHFSP